VEVAHALRTSELPDHHRDPFDRLLVARAQLLNIPIVTSDPQLTRYDVALIPA
jgi:PIN domain nuclease of toxin-antitoxin system